MPPARPEIFPDPSLNQESRFGYVIATLTIGSVLSTITVVLRWYSRHVLIRNFGYDDAAIIVAQALTIATAIAMGLEAHWGLGRHVWTVSETHYISYMKAFYSSVILYSVSLSGAKVSIVLQYRRIFPVPTMETLTSIYLCFMFFWTVTHIVMLSIACLPVEAFWNPHVPGGRCFDLVTMWYVMAGVNFATDIVLFITPMPVIKSLRLPRFQKWLLAGIFGLGIFPCVVAMYRIPKLYPASLNRDITWDNVDAAIFSFLELTIAVVAACLPTLRPVLAAVFPRLAGSALRPHQGVHSTCCGGVAPIDAAPRHNGGRDPFRLSETLVDDNYLGQPDLETREGLQDNCRLQKENRDQVRRCSDRAREGERPTGRGKGPSDATRWDKSTETLATASEEVDRDNDIKC